MYCGFTGKQKKGEDDWFHNGVQEKDNRMNYNMLRHTNSRQHKNAVKILTNVSKW